MGGGVGREGHGSCTLVHRLSELNDRLIGADRGVGGDADGGGGGQSDERRWTRVAVDGVAG